MGVGGRTPEAGNGSSSSIRQETELGKQGTIRPQNWTTLPTYTTKFCPLPRRPYPSFRALYSQVLTSQRLLGKVLDIYILVLRQLLQDGLDFTLQCAGKGGEKKVVNKARLRQGESQAGRWLLCR